MSFSEDAVQGVRDALEVAGELVTYEEDDVEQGSIYARITLRADLYTEAGMFYQATTLRVVKEDVPNLTKKASFVTELEVEYFYKKLISDDGISVLLEVGK